MSFCTAINCMDGRTQLPVIEYLQKRFNVKFVDTITEPGPNKILAEATDEDRVQSILRRCEISLQNHDSVGIAVVGHHDCAGNPTSEAEQKKHTERAISFLEDQWNSIEVIGLWVDADFQVHDVKE